MGKVLLFGMTAFLLLAILALFLRKAGLQLQYLRRKTKLKSSGRISDFWRFDWSNPQERRDRWEAFLLFPMLYAVVLDDQDEKLNDLKREVKRTHILIYLMLVILVILGIYSERFLPAA